MFTKLKGAFLAAPADKILPTMFVLSSLFFALPLAACGMPLPYPIFGGMSATSAICWWLARRARVRRERAGCNPTPRGAQ